MKKSNNKMELGSHVYNSAADKAAARRDYYAAIKTASDKEIEKLNKRDGIMRALGIPALSNHQAYFERYGADRAYFAWSAFHEVNATLDGEVREDRSYQSLRALDEILMDQELDLDGLKEAIRTCQVDWYTYDLESGIIVDADRSPLYDSYIFKASGDFSWCKRVHFLDTVDDFSDEARVRDLFAVTPEEREMELARRDRESAEKKYLFLIKDSALQDRTFRFRGQGLVIPALGYAYRYVGIELPDMGWKELKEADEAFIVLQVPEKPSRQFPVIFYAGFDFDAAKAVYESLIADECKALAEKRGNKVVKSTKSSHVTAAQVIENLSSVKMTGYDMPYHTDLLLTFGLKGVQFGNSTATRGAKLTAEHKAYLTRLDEFLTVTADILGIMPEDMGQIVRSYAWGARGKGSALAHYEGRGHLDNIVNATRTRGHEGVHAHEFGHGLDYFIAWNCMREDKTSASNFVHDNKVGSTFLPKACHALIDFINDPSTKYHKDSCKADGHTIKKYFSAPTEMFARAFASFLEDELKDLGISAPFAVRGENCPPKGKERETLRRLFRDAIDELIDLGYLRKKTYVPEDVPVAACKDTSDAEADSTPFTVTDNGQLSFF